MLLRRPAGPGDEPFESLARDLGGLRLLPSDRVSSWGFDVGLLGLAEEDIARSTGSQGVLDARLTLCALRYAVVEDVALRPGGTVSSWQGRLTIASVGLVPGGVAIDARHAFLQRVTHAWESLGSFGPPDQLVLSNPRTQQAIVAVRDAERRMYYSAGFGWQQLGTGRVRYLVPDPDRAVLRIDQSWLDGARLIVMRPESLGVFTTPLKVEALDLGKEKQSATRNRATAKRNGEAFLGNGD